MSVRTLDVYLLTDSFEFLWDGDGTPSDFSTLIAGVTYNLFGRFVYDWGENIDDPINNTTHIRRHRRVKYLNAITANANDASLSTGDRAEFSLQLAPGNLEHGALTAVEPRVVNFTFSSTENSGP